MDIQVVFLIVFIFLVIFLDSTVVKDHLLEPVVNFVNDDTHVVKILEDPFRQNHQIVNQIDFLIEKAIQKEERTI